MAKRPTSNRELAISFEGPAFAINRFFVAVNPLGVRLAFTEQEAPDADPRFRTAVIMAVQDAIALRDLLTDMLKSVSVESAVAGQTLQ